MNTRKFLQVTPLLFSLTLLPFLAAPAGANAAVADWQKGVSIEPFGGPADDLQGEDFHESLQDLRDVGATYVTLVVPQYQSTTTSADIGPGWNTPSDEVLIDAIEYAQSLGFNVMLKPHLNVEAGNWRANIDASDRDEWFQNYGDMIRHYARMAEEHDVEQLSVGAELITMATETSNADNTWRWEELITSVREVYSGDLTYSANWGGGYFEDEKNHIEFWDDLDYIGISAYFDFDQGDSVEDMHRAWDEHRRNDIEPLQNEFDKPIIFTEIGYRSVDGARERPWYFCNCGTYDAEEQARLYEALFSYWDDYSYVDGVHLWNWKPAPEAGGEGNVDYTPQNKPAEEVIQSWFTRGGSDDGSDDGGQDDSDANFGAVAQVSGSVDMDNAEVEVDVTNTGGDITDAIVDVEVYDPSGSQVSQEFFEGQDFASGDSATYFASWDPSQAGDYTVKVGVFASGWSDVFLWEDEALSVTVSGGSDDSETSDGDMHVWWPTDGSTVSGTQPFKAQIIGVEDVTSYDMYWRVGDGGLVEMYNSYETYPHKEAQVDLSGWNWEGDDLYDVTFVAREFNGDAIDQETVTIEVR